MHQWDSVQVIVKGFADCRMGSSVISQAFHRWTQFD
ncbi:protein of unknown function [Burkholderia multivorans]